MYSRPPIDVQPFDVKVERLRAGITQWRLAQHLGISPGVLSCIETGRRPVTMTYLHRILRAIHDVSQQTDLRGASRG